MSPQRWWFFPDPFHFLLFLYHEPRSADITIDTDLGGHLEMQVIKGERISEYKPLYINHFLRFYFP